MYLNGPWYLVEWETCDPDPRPAPTADTAMFTYPQCLPTGSSETTFSSTHKRAVVHGARFGMTDPEFHQVAVVATEAELRFVHVTPAGALSTTLSSFGAPLPDIHALYAANLFARTSAWPGAVSAGPGEEVLLGDPSNDTLYVAIVRYNGVDEAAADSFSWQVFEAYSDPSLDGGGFGTAIAAPFAFPHVADEWIAVSAPGKGKILLLETDGVWDTTTPSPPSLSVLQELTGATGLGASLTSHDVDFDGLPDLIVGNANARQVSVYWGCNDETSTPSVCPSSGAGPFHDQLKATLQATTDWGEFGRSVDFGKLNTDGDFGIVVGAPGHTKVAGGSSYKNAGGVCWSTFDGRTASALTCQPNPLDVLGTAESRFGEVVRFANVSRYDNFARSWSQEGLMPELVVSAPGSVAIDLTRDPSLGYAASGGSDGAVWVFRQSANGPVIERTGPSARDHAIHVIAAPGGERFGGSLAVLGRDRYDPSPDLLIGHGHDDNIDVDVTAVLTVNEPTTEFGDVRIGRFTSDDGAVDWDVFLTEQDRVGFANRQSVSRTLTDEDGEICTYTKDGEVVFDGTITLAGGGAVLPTVDLDADERGVVQCIQDSGDTQVDVAYDHFESAAQYEIDPEEMVGCPGASDEIVLTKSFSPSCEP